MSSNNYDQRSYIQKINLDNNSRRTRSKPPKLCPYCKETSSCAKLFFNKVNKIEEIVDGLKNLDQFSTFRPKFTLNNVPCELEYNLSNFALEDLQKLVIFTPINTHSFSAQK